MNEPSDPLNRRCAPNTVDSHPERASIYGRTAHLRGRSRPRQDRLDWPSMKQRIDLTAVVADLLGAAGRPTGRAGCGGCVRSTPTATPPSA